MSLRSDLSLIEDILAAAREAYSDVQGIEPEALFQQHIRMLGLV